MISHRLSTVAALEIRSGGAGADQPIIGVIEIKLSEQGDLDEVATQMDTLSARQRDRFERLGDSSDLANAISNMENAVVLTDDGHPLKRGRLSNLGFIQHRRFERLWNLSDLEDALSNIEKANALTDNAHPHKPNYFANLCLMQQTRYEYVGNLSDLENAVSNGEKAVVLTDDGHPLKPDRLSNLGGTQHHRFEHLGNIADIQNAISNLEKAVALTEDRHPDKPKYLSNLGCHQDSRFSRLGDITDLENAILNMTLANEFTDDNCPTKASRLLNLGHFQLHRFERLGDDVDLENAVSNKKRAVELTNNGNRRRPGRLSSLGITQYTRFKRTGELTDIEDAIFNIEKAAELTNDAHPDKLMYLSNLGCCQQTRFDVLDHLPDLQNAILNLGKAVRLTEDSRPAKADRLSNLGVAQRNLFKCLGDLHDLDNSILNIGKAVELTDDSHWRKAEQLRSLGISQKTRFECLGDQVDLLACAASFKAAAQLTAAYPSSAFAAAVQWANASHLSGDIVSALDGCRTALEFLPKLAWLGLNIPSRQSWLLLAEPEHLGCCAANCAIRLGCLEEAVELLDLSRSIFWQQASSLRSEWEILREEEPKLAEEFERVGRQLDAGNFFDSAFVAEGNVGVGHHSTEDIGRERRQLVSRWEGLLERVRQCPKFKYFLRPIPFGQLRQASTAGQVVIINASVFGVDALIFGPTGPIEHVPLPDINLATLADLSGDIVLKQPINASASQRRNYVSHFLKPTLRTIWNDILIHIFGKIHISLADATMSPCRRIWWYPTGPLTFIPIHAAGPGSGVVDVSRLVVSSYVTTLQSLFQAQKQKKPISERQQKLLSVSQVATPGQISLPNTIEEVDELARILHSSGWPEGDIICLRGSDATVERVSHTLDSCSWIHFACHGYQDPIQGMKSAFALHDGHLKLHEIASKRLSTGQFAFLSACHAASGLKDLPGEAMHLAAGIQFTGFLSVIATMWSIRDEDAPKVADYTYQYLFRNGVEDLDPSEAAKALNHAVLCLRQDPSITVDRWAPFIHFGI
jgi:hypothetical protein